MTDKKLLLLKSHQFSDGLTDDELNEIADHIEVVEYDSGEIVYRPHDRISDVHLVVQGRFRISVLDQHGNPFLEYFLTRGDQFGAVEGAYGEPL